MRLQRPLIALSLTLLLAACGGTEGVTDLDTSTGTDTTATPSDDAMTSDDDTAVATTDTPVVTPDTTPADDLGPADDTGTQSSDVCADEADGAECDDGNACTVDDACSAGQCVGGSNLVCDSTDACRVSGCDPAIGCYTTPVEDGTPCSAGCFESAACQGGGCQVDADTAVVCPEPEDPCVDQLQCDPGTGACTVSIFKAPGTACDADENVCTEDLCDDVGTCEPTGEVNTCQEENENNPCWTWSCSAKTGCYQTTFVEGVSCDDNNPCTYSDTCTVNEFDQELCVGEALPIDDGNPCTDDGCDGGTITHEPIDGLSCDVADCDLPGLCTGGQCEAPDSCTCTPTDGGWSDWTLGDCDAACGEGEQLATRTCSDPVPSCGGADCVGDATEYQTCEADECGDGLVCDAGQCVAECTAVDGGWSDWTLDACDVDCGSGEQLATRTCSDPMPSCGGADCVGDASEYQSCDAGACGDGLTCDAGQCVAGCTAVDGGWSAWSLGACNAECGFGELLATRTCDTPVPSCGGSYCIGDSSELQICDAGGCADGYFCDAGQCAEQCTPIAGGWSEWTWGACSVECGGGTQIGTRTCNNPAPSCNGAMCPGDSQTEAPCNTEPCDDGTFPLGKTIYDHPEEVVTRTIPGGVTSMTVSLWGAGGAGGLPGVGGAGAWVHGTIAVTPGDSVELRVAGGGTDDGRGGGASYVFVNGEVMLVAAGGGGAGSDGNSGKTADAGSGSGGGGGALGGAGQAGTLSNPYGCGSAGGQGGQQSAGGQGGTSNNQSMYTSGCISAGEAGEMHQGGGTHKGGSCNVSQTGGSWHQGGTTSATNGEGGGGGAGYYGGGSGATFWTYAGGGGGGGSSWAHSSVTSTQSEGGSGISPGGMSAADYNGTAGRGGMPGDWSNWPTTTIDPEPGATGLVVLSL